MIVDEIFIPKRRIVIVNPEQIQHYISVYNGKKNIYQSVYRYKNKPSAINAIVDKILPNIKYSKNLNDAIKDNITGVYNEVLENKIVKNLVQQGKLKVVKAYYDLDGTVEFQ